MTARFTDDEARRAHRKVTLGSTVVATADFDGLAQVAGEWAVGVSPEADGLAHLLFLATTATNSLGRFTLAMSLI